MEIRGCKQVKGWGEEVGGVMAASGGKMEEWFMSEGEGCTKEMEKDKSYAVSNKSEEHFIMWCKVCKKSDLTNTTQECNCMWPWCFDAHEQVSV